MLEHHEAHDRPDSQTREPARDVAAVNDRPLADREVPLPGMAAADASTSMVHQWLDGEVSEADMRAADPEAVEFWARVHLDAARHAATKAPVHLIANVMAAIPVKER